MPKLTLDDFWTGTAQPSSQLSDEAVWCQKVNVDGVILSIDDAAFSANEVFGGSNLVVSQWFVSRAAEPFIWGEVYEHLLANAEAVFADHLAVPSADFLLTQVHRLASHNHYPPFARFRFTFFRNSEKNISPHWVLMQQRLASHPFSLSDDKLFLSLYDRPFVSPSPLTAAGTLPADVLLAMRAARLASCSQACLLNTQGHIATTTLGNIYLVNGLTVVTSACKAGARRDPLQPYVLRAFAELGFECYEEERLETAIIERANECAIADVRFGIMPVLGIGEKRFYRSKTLLAAEKLKGFFA